MKNRIFANWVTSIFGTLLMLAAIAMYVANRIPQFEVNFSIIEMVSVAVLGWVFLTAQDTLLEGLFCKVFKIKPKK